jgi:hypothetical protein
LALTHERHQSFSPNGILKVNACVPVNVFFSLLFFFQMTEIIKIYFNYRNIFFSLYNIIDEDLKILKILNFRRILLEKAMWQRYCLI